MRALVVGAFVVFIALAGPIACMMPAAAPYQPLTGQEGSLLARARRDLLPEEVRSLFAKPGAVGSNAALVAWTGILREKTSSDGAARFVIDHHYWDWIDDYGTQSERVFLSSRGEGAFSFVLGGDEGQWLLRQAHEGDMLIVYGVPVGVDQGGAIELRYVHARGIPASLYATDVLDYGRGMTAPAMLRIDAF
jgi:hypothetical protein